MQRYLAGDQRAFAALHARHEPLVRHIVTRAGVRRDEVDDLTQQTFVRLHVARARYRSGERLKPWLCAMARNVCRDHGRRRKRRPEITVELDELTAEASLSNEARSSEARSSEARVPLLLALDVLSEPTRHIFHQHFLEDRALIDIARELGTKPSTVRVRVHRGCQQLREALRTG